MWRTYSKKKDLEAKLLNKYYNEKEKESNKNDELYTNFRIEDKKPKIILITQIE